MERRAYQGYADCQQGFCDKSILTGNPEERRQNTNANLHCKKFFQFFDTGISQWLQSHSDSPYHFKAYQRYIYSRQLLWAFLSDSSHDIRRSMNTGKLTAWNVITRKPMCILWNNGVITRLESSVESPGDTWFAPPLFDVQVNGYGGVDFQQDDLAADALLQAARSLRKHGCTGFLLTLITDEWSQLTSRLHHFVTLREQSEELKSAIIGWHVEGPFLSPEAGFHGAHDPSLMLDPTPGRIRELRALAGDSPLLLTLAPERHNALDAIKVATSLGIKVSLGHTNASAETLAHAVRAGATMFTHLANGCPRNLDRHDNILWRVLETPGLTPSLIPDGIHVSPAPFRLIHQALNNAAFYTTDAMAAAGAEPGRYTIGKLTVKVGADQIVRQPGETNFAGSALRPIDGVFRAAQMLNAPWQEAWLRFSLVPARLLGISRELQVGGRATFCIIRVDDDNRFRDLQVVWNG